MMVSLTTIASNQEPLRQRGFEKVVILKLRKHLEGSFTMSGGCHISYSIDVDYSLVPPRINSFHGSVTMSGNCSGEQTFRGSANTDAQGTITSVSTDLKGEELQSAEFNNALAKSLNEQNLFK